MTLKSNQKQKTVAIVVPWYKERLTVDEEISLRHVQHYLGSYDKYLVTPGSLKIELPDFEVRTFSDEYFRSVLAYNKLMLAPRFYKTFNNYRYILLYQLDALVFSDQLMEWCATELDYIGAPWLKNMDVPEEGFSNVGNGGFSLRKVDSMLKVLSSPGIVTDASAYWVEYRANHSRLNQIFSLHKKYMKKLSYFSGVRWYSRHPHDMEDIFWANIAPKLYPDFKIASVEQALKFSFESGPRYCFEQNGNQLPFGCHSWEKYDRAFWEQYLLDEVRIKRDQS